MLCEMQKTEIMQKWISSLNGSNFRHDLRLGLDLQQLRLLKLLSIGDFLFELVDGFELRNLCQHAPEPK